MPTFVTGIMLKDDAKCTRTELAIALRKLPRDINNIDLSKLPMHKLMEVVDGLMKGCSLHLEHLTRPEAQQLSDCPYLVCQTTEFLSEWELEAKDRAARWEHVLDLKNRGAAGDAEAAIRFCQMSLSELYSLVAPVA